MVLLIKYLINIIKEEIERFNIEKRRLFIIENPFIPEKTPLNRTGL